MTALHAALVCQSKSQSFRIKLRFAKDATTFNHPRKQSPNARSKIELSTGESNPGHERSTLLTVSYSTTILVLIACFG